MIINEMLERRKISKYRLSKDSGVPQTTVNDICCGKADLDRCTAGTLYRIAQVLGITVEDILESADRGFRSAFETFKSNTCHRLRDLGDEDFLIELLESDEITALFVKGWYPEALYLLAMLDYLSRVNNVPICEKYDLMRQRKLADPLFPAGVLLTAKVLGSDEPLKKAEAEAIPEFKRFNIIESEVRNVV